MESRKGNNPKAHSTLPNHGKDRKDHGNSGPIKGLAGGDGFIDIRKVTVFIGDQGSGKSRSVAKTDLHVHVDGEGTC